MERVDCMCDILAVTSLTYKEGQNKKVLFSPVPQLMPQGAPLCAEPLARVYLRVLVTLYSISLTPSRCDLLGG